MYKSHNNFNKLNNRLFVILINFNNKGGQKFKHQKQKL